MPKTIKVSSLGFDDLTYSKAPSTVEEFNALDPKAVSAGENPCLDVATDDIMKHKVLGGFRSDLLDALEKKFGVERINHGTEKEPRWESDARFMNRLIALENVKRNGEGVALTDAFSATIRSEVRELAQTTLEAQDFVVAGREGGKGGAPVGKNDIKLATEAVDTGKAAALAALLSKAVGRDIPITGEKEADVLTLARALKDNRKIIADQIEAQQRATMAAA